MKIIPAPSTAKYLSEVFPEGSTLPQNCLFDKAGTGVGGSYVALTSPELTIITVPTKALVKDKATNPDYLRHGLVGVSSEFPLPKVIPASCRKIICTYQSLEAVAKKIDISKWHLVIDEMHMLTRMAGFTPGSLKWLVENFKSFKSYCFMSATVPPDEHLIPEIRGLDRVTIEWFDQIPVNYRCMHTSNMKDSILQIALNHISGVYPGNAYFFVNSVTAILNICTAMKALKDSLNIICSDSPEALSKLKAKGFSRGEVNAFKKVNFVTSTAFEGVDFMDPVGVTYIVSDARYSSTKYSVITTIPQIVGRMRVSCYKADINFLFNNHKLLDIRTKEELYQHIEEEENASKRVVELWNVSKSLPGEAYKSDKMFVEFAAKDPYCMVTGANIDLEDLQESKDFKLPEGIDIHFNPYARFLDIELYDILNTNTYVRDPSNAMESFKSQSHISSILSQGHIEEAPVLSATMKKKLMAKRLTFKEFCKVYEETPGKVGDSEPEYLAWIETLGMDKIKSLKYVLKDVKALYQTYISSPKFSIWSCGFNVGNTYTLEEITTRLQENGAPDTGVKFLKRWYELKTTSKRVDGASKAAYKIVRQL